LEGVTAGSVAARQTACWYLAALPDGQGRERRMIGRAASRAGGLVDWFGSLVGAEQL